MIKSSSSSSSSTPVDSAYRHALASQAAGTLATFAFNPLEIVKVRFMSQDGTSLRTHYGTRYSSTSQALQEMSRKEGLGVFFRGAHVAALASGFSHGIYMFCYRSLLTRTSSSSFFLFSQQQQQQQQQQQDKNNQNSSKSSSSSTFSFFSHAFACSVVANIMVALTANPIWLIKTRMQLEESGNFKSALACVRKSVQKDGVLVFWRGTSAQVLLSFPSSLHLPLYELLLRTTNAPLSRLKNQSATAGRSNNNSSNGSFVWPVIVCNTAAKTAVTILSHPFTLLRTRLQDVKARSGDLQYRTLRDVAVACLTQPSSGGFFRGLGPGLIQVVPRSVAHLLLYESIVMKL